MLLPLLPGAVPYFITVQVSRDSAVSRRVSLPPPCRLGHALRHPKVVPVVDAPQGRALPLLPLPECRRISTRFIRA